MVDGPPLTAEEHGRVLLITINRPHTRNAVSREVAVGIDEAVTRLDARNDLSVGVIHGAGGTFCSGMDLKDFSRGEVPTSPVRGFAGLVKKPSDKPLIAAVEGYALAGGFEIVLACDLVVAAVGAKFGLPEVKRGLTAAGGGLLRLPGRVPYNFAMELVLTGRLYPAEKLAAAGLVNQLCPDGEALTEALELARQISANAPLALAASKRVLSSSSSWPGDEAWDRQEQIVAPVRRSADAMEGAMAFLEKRPAKWSGS